MFRPNWWRPIDFIGCQLLGKSFVGGWSIEEVLRTGAELKKRGYGVTYNLLTEDLRDEKKVNQSASAIRALLLAMNKKNSGNVAIKPTQCGLMISYDLFLKTAEDIVLHAKAQGVETEFDAERWEFIPDTAKAFSTLSAKFHLREFMRLCVQAHLRQIFSLMDKYNLWPAKLRIVKGSGIYPESDGVIFFDPLKVRWQYFTIGRCNLSSGRMPYFATMRDKSIIGEVKEVKVPYMLGPFKPEVQMLYGPLGRELGEELLREGYPVRIYIPFVAKWCQGAWLPYGMRRSATIRHLFFADKEVRRAMLQELKNKFRRR